MKNKILPLSGILLVIIAICLLIIKPVFKNINYGLDLKGGFEVLYLVEPLDEKDEITNSDLTSTYKSILNRIDTLGVSEPNITIEGNKIRVQLPGVKNESEARERLSTPAVLTFRNTKDEQLMTSNILGTPGAKLDYDSTGMPVVALNIKDSDTFYNITKEISKSDDKLIVIWLDFTETDSFASQKEICGIDGNMKCISAATVEEAFSGNVVIKGGFTKDEANELVDLINSGSLPTKLTEVSTKTVDASFGSNTLKVSLIAGIITLIVITLIMTIIYRASGLICSICLLLYSILVFITFNAIGGVLTLTGIAALVLGIGMGVDSCVVTLEKIKDELRNKKGLETSFKEGNKTSLISLIDANATTFIAALALFIFGESSVKGFATMLILTIVVTLITMIFFNRFILGLFVKTGYFNKKIELFIGKYNTLKKKNFMKYSIHYIIIVLVSLVLGIIFYFSRGINFGIDFKGGTSINVKSEETINVESIDEILNEYNVVTHEKISNNELNIKLENVLNTNEMKELKNELEVLNYNSDISVISNFVKKELTINAIKSLIMAVIGILIYIAIRFTTSYAISSIIALFTDVIVTISLFLIFKIEINFIFIAALLTIIGYSINDTIIIFDMIREELGLRKEIKTKEELTSVVNESLKKTLTRTIITSLTTLTAVTILLVLKTTEIQTFNIALFIGLIAGTLSSIFIATKLWIYLTYKNLNKKKKSDSEEDDEFEEKLIKGINS